MLPLTEENSRMVPLTEENREVVLNSDGNLCVTAGAGSGKTTLLIERLLRKGASTSPANMVVITFTRAAAREVRERVEKELGVDFAQKLEVRTLHSFFYGVLKKDLNLKRTVIDETVEKALFKDLKEQKEIPDVVTLEAVKDYAFRRSATKVVSWLPESGKKKVLDYFAEGKQKPLTPFSSVSDDKEELHEQVEKAAKRFYSLVRKYNFLTFDGIFFKMVDLLNSEKVARAVAKKLRSRVRYLFIDEFQDVDVLQYAVLSKIFKGSQTSVFVIGDPMQSIYEWRKAFPYVFELYKEDFNPKTYFLDSNYRCARSVVELINGVRKRYGDGLTQKPKREFYGEIVIKGIGAFKNDRSYNLKTNPNAFINRVAYLKRELTVNDYVERLINEAEKQKKTVAILCRTNLEKNYVYSGLKSVYANVLKENRIYQLSKEVSAVLSAVGVALKPQLTGTSFVHSLLTKKFVGIGTKSFVAIQKAIREINREEDFKVYEELEKGTLQERIYRALKKYGVKGKRLSKLTQVAVSWISDLNEVKKTIESADSTVRDVFFKVDEVFEVTRKSYEEDLKVVKKKKLNKVVTPEEKVQMLDMVADVAANYLKSKYFELLQDGDAEPTKIELFRILSFDKGGFEDYVETFVNEGGFVKIMTIHQSKGREFDAVIFPATYDLTEDKDEESKRLLYVALSRAKDYLMVVGDPELCQKLKSCVSSNLRPMP